MEGERWIRLITIGLVLAAMAFGYFLISGRFAPKAPKPQLQVRDTFQSPIPSPSAVLGTNSQATASAYTRIVERTRAGVQTLPKTGFPYFLVGVISLGVLVAGLGLRKYPH